VSDLSDEQRSHHSNLILFCRDHHATVDAQPSTYSVQVLRQMKADHEKRVATALNPLESTVLPKIANVRLHATTRERPRVRFDREERFLLQPLAPRRYTSLVLERPAASAPARRRPRPVVTVEKRSLTAYAQLTGGVA
jgi:hypothetical protein